MSTPAILISQEFLIKNPLITGISSKKPLIKISFFIIMVKIKKNIVSDSAAFAPELTIEFINSGFRLIEIPVNYYPRNMGVSKISGTYMKSAITALKMLKIIVLKRFIYFFKK